MDSDQSKMELEIQHRSNIKFMQDLLKKFTRAEMSTSGKKRSKRPVFKGWLDVTEEQSAELALHADYRDGQFMFLTGKTTKYFAVDIDTRDESRDDHKDKTDGREYWDSNFEESDHMNTLIIKTPSGGFHLVYKYEEGITSGQLKKDVLIDILSDGRAICFGPGYEILNRAMPTSAPPKLVQIIINNNNNYGSQIVNLPGSSTQVSCSEAAFADPLGFSVKTSEGGSSSTCP